MANKMCMWSAWLHPGIAHLILMLLGMNGGGPGCFLAVLVDFFGHLGPTEQAVNATLTPCHFIKLL